MSIFSQSRISWNWVRRTTVITVFVVAVFVFGCFVTVQSASRFVVSIDDLESAPIAIVLGAKVKADGVPDVFLDHNSRFCGTRFGHGDMKSCRRSCRSSTRVLRICFAHAPLRSFSYVTRSAPGYVPGADMRFFGNIAAIRYTLSIPFYAFNQRNPPKVS